MPDQESSLSPEIDAFLWSEPTTPRRVRAAPVCAKCQTIHCAGDVVAVGRFDPNGVHGYRPRFGGCGCLRATRDEAMDDKHENGCRFGLGPDEPDAFDSLPIAALLHARLASWFGDDRQSFLVADLVPVVTQIVADFQYNALDMARKAHIAEIHAEEAEYHVEQLRDALDSAERRLEQAERRAECAEDGNRGLIATCEAAGAKIQALETAIQRLREALDESRGEVGTGAGEGATGQDTGTAWVTRSTDCPEAPAQAHLPAWSAMEAYRCWCGSPTGVRVPGDRSGVGCLANITHNWAAPVTPCSYTTSTADYCHAHNAPLADTEGRCEAVTGPAGNDLIAENTENVEAVAEALDSLDELCANEDRHGDIIRAHEVRGAVANLRALVIRPVPTADTEASP